MPVLHWRGNQIHSSEQSCRILLQRGDMLYWWCCRIIPFSGRYIGEMGCFQGSLVLDLSSSLGLLEYLSWPCQMSYCPTFGWQRSGMITFWVFNNLVVFGSICIMFIYLIIVVINLSIILIFLYYNLLIQNLNKQVNYDLKS